MGDVTPFGSMAFDCYVTEQWDPSSTLSRRDQHIALGKSFARLGHKGRRPYVHQAAQNDTNQSAPRDLLTPQERNIAEIPDLVWIRTSYTPGTDARHAELISAYPDLIDAALGSSEHILNDSNRYSALKIPDLYAFIPHILISQDPTYENANQPWDSEELQEELFPPDWEVKDQQAGQQGSVIVADEEAMRTGFLLWVQPDEFGGTLQWNRIQPWSLRVIASGIGNGFGLGEMRGGYEDGYLEGFGVGKDERCVLAWEPPAARVREGDNDIS